ncbi:MAG TPA: DNA circularization N-terminal domain-containing protein [Longimicrobium sp.]|nr:DNA circularization N-terminal domain-containing protein [Longimicrobium sp.]
MPIQLADLTLNRVHRITTLEQAAFVHHRVPGATGDVLQDLGRRSVRLRIEGICFGTTAVDDLEALRGLYIAREPVDFIADLVGQTYVSRVALDRLEVTDSAADPEQFSWTLTVSEYVEPPQSNAAAMEAVDAGIAMDAATLMDIATLPDALALGSLPEISNPFEPLTGALSPVADGAKALNESMSGLKMLFGI